MRLVDLKCNSGNQFIYICQYWQCREKPRHIFVLPLKRYRQPSHWVQIFQNKIRKKTLELAGKCPLKANLDSLNSKHFFDRAPSLIWRGYFSVPFKYIVDDVKG